MSKPPRDDPRRVESSARMTMAEAMPTPQEPVMQVAETAPSNPLAEGYQSPGDGGGEFFELAPPHNRISNAPFLPQDPARPWHPMTESPQDGTLLEGRSADGTEFHMIWRRTSRYDAARMKWVPVGFWSSHLSREPLKVEPVSWRLPRGFQMPGMIAS
jgi:hypothetical protein